jgi:hypothetical protein
MLTYIHTHTAMKEPHTSYRYPYIHTHIHTYIHTVMKDPVMAMDGHTYERDAIANWFLENQKSPMTNCMLEAKLLLPNHALRSMIMDWKDARVKK